MAMGEELEKLKIVLFVVISLCLILSVMFALKIKHQNSVDAIFEQYEIDMDKLHDDMRKLRGSQ